MTTPICPTCATTALLSNGECDYCAVTAHWREQEAWQREQDSCPSCQGYPKDDCQKECDECGNTFCESDGTVQGAREEYALCDQCDLEVDGACPKCKIRYNTEKHGDDCPACKKREED